MTLKMESEMKRNSRKWNVSCLKGPVTQARLSAEIGRTMKALGRDPRIIAFKRKVSRNNLGARACNQALLRLDPVFGEYVDSLVERLHRSPRA